MFCSKCGKQLNQVTKFCPNCGNQVNGAVTNVNSNYNNPNSNNNVYVNQYQQSEPSCPASCIVGYIMAALVVLAHLTNIGSILSIFADSKANEIVGALLVNTFSIPIMYIIGLISTIVGKSQHPKNKHAKALLIIYIILGIIIVLETILLVSLIGSCISQLNDCSSMG